MDKSFLPIGSVVIIEGCFDYIMITGYLSIDKEKPDQMYDYCGCLYPLGEDGNRSLLFNREDILDVVFKGYINNQCEKILSKFDKKVTLESKKELLDKIEK